MIDIPFVSQAQRRYLFMTDPALAKEFASKTPNIKGLPEHAKTKSKSKTQRKGTKK